MLSKLLYLSALWKLKVIIKLNFLRKNKIKLKAFNLKCKQRTWIPQCSRKMFHKQYRNVFSIIILCHWMTSSGTKYIAEWLAHDGQESSNSVSLNVRTCIWITWKAYWSMCFWAPPKGFWLISSGLGSQVMLILLVQGPHLQNHGSDISHLSMG